MYKSFDDIGVEKPNTQQVKPQLTVTEITTQTDKNRILSSNRLVCVDIYAEWCAPCKKLEPEYLGFSKLFSNRKDLVFAKENIELNLSQGVKSIPTFQIFFDGKHVETVVGGNLSELNNKLTTFISVLDSDISDSYKGPSLAGRSQNSVRNNGNYMNGHN
jgi:thioredoxin 1